LLVEVSRALPAPSGKSLYDEWKISRKAELSLTQAVPDAELANTRIGSGSDHTVFLNYLGIPTVGLTFTGPYGVYHSMYDDFFWMNHFGDPGYRYHTLMAQLWGVLALRLANAEILPYDFDSYGENIRQFVVDLNLASHASGHIDLAALQQHITDFQAAGRELNSAVARAISSGRLDAAAAAGVNQQLMQVERNWCNPQGIPGRPWFKHSLYGARYTYAHLELPGLTEAAEAGDWKVAAEQAKILQDELAKNTELLKQTRAMLETPSARAQ
jgi:N-acetylated-alpha-linked acidic dipeptidase